ncbi:peroxisomal N(1)-acetyl-spermine/spermidine oxidase isoform X2 [Pleurodeles waltl]|uniref:peroxisomal N(1)-acetyl-spermine/spermidine oxidase isoform X2 n=1 Tax=Pleurodeles waltl TaxID=8319 RepID=UPI003709C48A
MNEPSRVVTSMDLPKPEPVIVIIGCGISGIGAAERLYRHGLRNVKILEASHRPGGRIWSTQFGKGVVEIGAHWIHGPSDRNPVFHMASQYGLLHESALAEENKSVEVGGHSPFCPVAYSSSGKVIGVELQEAMSVVYSRMFNQAREFLHVDVPLSESVGEYMKKEIAHHASEWGDDLLAKQLKLAVLSSLLKLECCISGTHSMNDVALRPFGEYKMLPGLDCTITGGYQGLIECMLTSLPKERVLLNKSVRTVHWNGTFKGQHNDERFFPVQVECEDGDAFNADHVIITVPLGFLKEKYATLLDPPLPDRKLQAIQKMGFGTNNKIFLEFETPFWKPDCQEIEFVWEEESPLVDVQPDFHNDWFKKLPGFMVLHPPEQFGHVLCGFIPGKESEFMETLTDAEITTSVMEVLRRFTGNSGLAPPVRMLRSKWHSQPFTKGSYSYVSIGCSGDDIDIIAKPLPENTNVSKPLQVLFAGEATHRTFYSTTHGALESGWREAERLIHFYTLSEPQRSKPKL